MIVDTSAYSQFKNGVQPATAVARQAPCLIMSSIVMGELLAGFRCGNRFEANRIELDEFLAWHQVRVVHVTSSTATFYAGVFASLRAIGRPMPQNELWLAALAHELDMPIWTYDVHFTQVPGLRIVREVDDLK